MKKLKSSLPIIALALSLAASFAFKPAENNGKAPENFYWFSLDPDGRPILGPDKPPVGPTNPYGCDGKTIYCTQGYTGYTYDNGEYFPSGASTPIFYEL